MERGGSGREEKEGEKEDENTEELQWKLRQSMEKKFWKSGKNSKQQTNNNSYYKEIELDEEIIWIHKEN